MTYEEFKNLSFSPNETIWIKVSAGEMTVKHSDVYFHGFPLNDAGHAGIVWKADTYDTETKRKKRILYDIIRDSEMGAEMESRIEAEIEKRVAERVRAEIDRWGRVDIQNYVPYSWSFD